MTGNYVGNLPSLEFENIQYLSHLSNAEYLHKSLGHASNQPFKEVHLDLIGPIWPTSKDGHRYILTLVDSCTQFCAAIPIKLKSDVAGVITFLIDIEAKRFAARPKGVRTPIRTPNKHGVQPLHAPLERRAGAARHSQHAARLQ
ncbi:hypothetical protein PCANC_09786 [Puccinia coronata f. sp. avenae]|uniref:Integrase catalytic domain-containing protein n=1 Tax=Puccinia coronata f. sp. avenae TaxID=200324 RepID=A0A2N5VT66_9BASI|nr:hypothetical protein PCANC_09786 [Puccinia coronata f. sp. avenae]